MRWSAKKLRWLALGGTLLLAGIVAAFLGMANYRAGKIWQRILKRNGVNLVQESNGITYSQSVKGRTVFTLHAERSTPHGNGIYSLHNAVLILYGKNGRNDRIHGNEFEYDQNGGVLRAVGEVLMGLEAPAPAGGTKRAQPTTDFSFAPDDAAAAAPQVIHVRTSGLVYLRKLNVATTKEPVEFSYRGMRCNSVGAEFDSGQSTLHLLSEVHLEGTLRGGPFTLAATRADLDRENDTVAMVAPAWAEGDRTARADAGTALLHKDGSLATADGRGHVVLRAEERQGSRSLSAPQLHTEFGPENRPQRAVFTGGVEFEESAAGAMTHGTAAGLTLTTDAKGALRSALAEGGVHAHAEQRAGKVVTATRDLLAQRALAGFVPGAEGKSSRVQSLHMMGAVQLGSVQFAAQARGGVKAAGATRTGVRADDLVASFGGGTDRPPQLQRVVGMGHTVLSQNGADGQRQVSEGDALDAAFVQRTEAGGGSQRPATEVSTAVQTGHVVLHAWPAAKEVAQGGEGRSGVGTGSGVGMGSGVGTGLGGPSVGHAQRAVFEASAGTLTLTAGGGARAEVDDGTTQLQAPEIILHQGTGDGDATGGVMATTVGQPGSAATHVLAARARLQHALDVAEFFGTDAEPAQMWQATSQVSAARLVLDARRHMLTARPAAVGGLVHGVFASEHARESGETHGTADGNGATESVEGKAAAGGRRGAVHEAAAEGRSDGSPSGAGGSPLRKGGDPRELANRPQTEVSGDAVRVAAEALDYSDPDHEATFHGNVVLRGVEGVLSGDRGVAFFDGSGAVRNRSEAESGKVGTAGAMGGLGGRLQRFVVMGDVRLKQPGRLGQGQQLTYTAATDRFVLTGAPGVLPRVVDAQQGTVTGETLVFGAADRSVVVASAPSAEAKPAGKQAAQPAGKQAEQMVGKAPMPRRVHTETDIKR